MNFISIAALSLIFLSISKTEMPTGLQVNEIAPNFSGTNQRGEKVDLNLAKNNSKIVLIFYRGEWCGYCNQQLANFQDSIAMIVGKGAQVIAVSPEKMENILKTVQKTKASFSVIGDNETKIMSDYKVKFKLDKKTKKQYKKWGIVLANSNESSNGDHLPVPATYIIAKDGKISYRFFNVDYSKRASVKQILENL
jgi:peroxiredoxin